MSSRTPEIKISQETYMKKLKELRIRVPKEYYQTIKEYADSKGMSVNKLVITLLEKEIGTEFTSIREQNRLKKEDLTE